MRRECSLLALTTLLLLAAPIRAGILELEVVAATGATHEWLPEGVMLDIYSSSTGNMIPVASQSGFLAWSADLRGENVVFLANDQALFRRTPEGDVSMLLQRGGHVPGAPEGAKWFLFTPTCLAEDGTLFFRAKLDSSDGGGGVTKENDLCAGRIAPDGTVTLLAREGFEAPGLPTHTLTGSSGDASPPPLTPRCTADGQATFVHPITAAGSDEYAIFHFNTDGDTTILLKTGDPAPGFDNGETFLGFAKSPRINRFGQLAFRGVIQGGTGGNTAIFGPAEAAPFTLLAHEGTPAPGSPEGTFEDVPVHFDKTIAANGSVAFIHTFIFNNWYIEAGLWRHDPTNPGVLTTLMMQSTPAPGLPEGWTTGALASLTGNSAGRLSVQGRALFGADELGEPLLDQEAVWVQNDAGDFVLAAITGEPAPGTDGATLWTINNAMFMNASGQTTFTGTLQPLPPVTSATDFGVWLYTPGIGTELLLREGEPVAIAQDDTRAIKSIVQASSFMVGSGGEDGLPIGLLDDGRAPFVVRFVEPGPLPGFQASAAIVVAKRIEDPCDPDTVDCDDQDSCTTDTCDPQIGCVHTPVDCHDNDACTTDSCDVANGCLNIPVDCDDADACTTDTCDAVAGCQYVAVDCDDADACTTDTCHEVEGCQYAAVDCQDDDACTVDTCDAIEGCLTAPLDCDDADACTVDSCDAVEGCQHAAMVCDDLSACTTDSCDALAGCQYVEVDCNDADACTTDSCDPDAGCSYTPVVCDDATVCTQDTCDAVSGCLFEAIDCDDDDACTTDSCDPVAGCQHATLDCDDGSACTTDSCDMANGCQYQEVDCDDSSLCTNDSCNPATGCEYVDVKCDDNVACTIDSCIAKVGCVFTPKVCDDNSPCTLDSCELGDCVFTKDPAKPNCCVDAGDCHDGDQCTVDTCANKLCQHTDIENCCAKDMDCSDGNICTVDLCDQAAHQCKFQEMAACCMGDDDCPDGSTCIEHECVDGLCLECASDGDCTAAGATCEQLPSGSYCLPPCDGGCADGTECVDSICTPTKGDCHCVEEPATYGCIDGHWGRFDTCGEAVETLDECPGECAPLDGCCAVGEFVEGGKCVGEDNPESPEADIITTEDILDPVEEVIATPDVPVAQDTATPEEDTGTATPGDDVPASGAEIVEEESGGGGGGCSTTGPSPATAGLLLSLLTLLAMTRRRRTTR